MKLKLFLTAIVFLSINLLSAQSFRSLYKEAFALLEDDDYENALPILMEMHDLQPNNANTKFSFISFTQIKIEFCAVLSI